MSRTFKIVKINSKNVNRGRYTTNSSPSSVARKVFSNLYSKMKNKNFTFMIKETTQGSKKKIYGPYKGKRIKLKKPKIIKFKGTDKPVSMRYETKIYRVKGKKNSNTQSKYKSIAKKRGGTSTFNRLKELKDYSFPNALHEEGDSGMWLIIREKDGKKPVIEYPIKFKMLIDPRSKQEFNHKDNESPKWMGKNWPDDSEQMTEAFNMTTKHQRHTPVNTRIFIKSDFIKLVHEGDYLHLNSKCQTPRPGISFTRKQCRYCGYYTCPDCVKLAPYPLFRSGRGFLSSKKKGELNENAQVCPACLQLLQIIKPISNTNVTLHAKLKPRAHSPHGLPPRDRSHPPPQEPPHRESSHPRHGSLTDTVSSSSSLNADTNVQTGQAATSKLRDRLVTRLEMPELKARGGQLEVSGHTLLDDNFQPLETGKVYTVVRTTLGNSNTSGNAKKPIPFQYQHYSKKHHEEYNHKGLINKTCQQELENFKIDKRIVLTKIVNTGYVEFYEPENGDLTKNGICFIFPSFLPKGYNEKHSVLNTRTFPLVLES